MRETLLSFLDDCEKRPTETAFVYWRGVRMVRWSYGQFAATAYQFARELEARQINKGERVLIQAENSPEYVAAMFGCWLRGVIVVPLDRQSAPDFIVRVQQQVSAKLMLVDDQLPSADLKIPHLSLDGLGELIAHHSTDPYLLREINKQDLIEIVFTSGTTADPRGVCITHRNFLANIEPLEREIKKYLHWERYFHPVRFLCLPPLSHIFGQFMGIFVPQLLGSEVYFHDSLNPSEMIETVKKQRISVIVSVPRVLETLSDKIERDYAAKGETEKFKAAFEVAARQHFLRRWWTFRKIHRRFGWKFWAFVVGGATLDEETETFWRRLGYAVLQGYGMTETASLISLPHPFKSVHGAIGKTLAGQEVKLAENGEILVRGENVSPGYWRGELKPVTDEEGWLRTGDIGERDEQGNLYFRSRQKDMIATSAGLKIYPDDLEAAINHQPEVIESCVVGIEGPHGPEPFAALILRETQASPETIIKRANETLAEHQRIRRWMIWPESDFPRTHTTQKVLRRVVAETVKAHLSGQPAMQGSADTLAELAARISGQQITSGSSASLATDLQLDSLGRVELLSALEDRYQIELDEAAFTSSTTLTDIEKMIREGTPEVAPYPYPKWSQSWPVSWIRRFVQYTLVLPLTWLLGRARVSGEEHLSGLHGPVLFIANHITYIDPALILYALPMRWRSRFAIAMMGEFLREWRRPPTGTSLWQRVIWPVQYALVVALFNVFPLPQKSGFRRSFAFAGELVDRGYSLLVFPEGKRTTHGNLNPFMSGIGLLVEKLGIPVVPIKIEGLFELKQHNRYVARSGQISIKFGAPVRIANNQTPAEITQELEAKLAAL